MGQKKPVKNAHGRVSKNVLKVEPEDSINEAEKIESMSREDLVNFMINGWVMENGV